MVLRDADGRPLEVVAVIRDVTQRKAMETQLAESEEMYRNLLDNISEAVYKIDDRRHPPLRQRRHRARHRLQAG